MALIICCVLTLFLSYYVKLKCEEYWYRRSEDESEEGFPEHQPLWIDLKAEKFTDVNDDVSNLYMNMNLLLDTKYGVHDLAINCVYGNPTKSQFVYLDRTTSWKEVYANEGNQWNIELSVREDENLAIYLRIYSLQGDLNFKLYLGDIQ